MLTRLLRFLGKIGSVLNRLLWSFRKIFLSPWYASILTLLLLFAGGLASLYSDEIKGAWPFNYRARHGWSWPAFFSWLCALLSALLFFFREFCDGRSKELAEKRLIDQADSLEKLIRTVPPSNFLASFVEMVGACDDVLSVTLGHPEPPFDSLVVERAVRQVLGKVAALAKVFDGDAPHTNYAANIMVYHESSSLTAAQKQVIRGGLKFCDESTSLDNLAGVLVLYRRFSAVSGDKHSQPDPGLQHFALPVPKTQRNPITNRWFVLPGAPHAFVTGEPDIFLEVSQIENWCKQYGDFKDQVIRDIMAYLTAEDARFRSFISVPLAGSHGDADKQRFAVMNVHCSRPGMLKNQPEAVGQFVTLMQPLGLMISKLLWSHPLVNRQADRANIE